MICLRSSGSLIQDGLAKKEPTSVFLSGVFFMQGGQVLVHVRQVGPQEVEGAGGEVTLLVWNSQLFKLVKVLRDVSVEQQGGGARCNNRSNQSGFAFDHLNSDGNTLEQQIHPRPCLLHP